METKEKSATETPGAQENSSAQDGVRHELPPNINKIILVYDSDTGNMNLALNTHGARLVAYGMLEMARERLISQGISAEILANTIGILKDANKGLHKPTPEERNKLS
jgi:hypothetical protein